MTLNNVREISSLQVKWWVEGEGRMDSLEVPYGTLGFKELQIESCF